MTLYEKSVAGRLAFSFGFEEDHAAAETCVPEFARAAMKPLPQVSELDLVRHFTNLARTNYGVDTGFYPLGSCTMKYNPKINERMAADPRLTVRHPLDDATDNQGVLHMEFELKKSLQEITGMDDFTLQPACGAHGELTGMLIIHAYMCDHDADRTKVLIPDSAHGTNPASAAMAGFDVVTVPSDERGGVDMDALDKLMDNTVAAIMLTNPNTVGLFEENITRIADLVHARGGLLYYDGANLNALMGLIRPGDLGFDVVHLNLHKTFSTPHGGGGPGAAPVGVKRFLADYLPIPVVVSTKGHYALDEERQHTIGRVSGFYGNTAVLARAYVYIRMMGRDGLLAASRAAVINANYVKALLSPYFPPAYDRPVMHETVLSAKGYDKYGVTLLDIAKRLMDYGFHPPTIYFPHFPPYAEEVMMVEPTESESKETMDAFCDALIKISQEAKEHPELLLSAPHDTVVTRVDSTYAARHLVTSHRDKKGS
ncbi:MAG: aminomethyl-transferring glycine dehydrogenase subunit GcvPB [Caldiserica bacterium]|nr:aminomethyl-transferring glycine dehydrogenase subunit GcvPB [Caldisericota bacterium]